jgi:hypothetical protein
MFGLLTDGGVQDPIITNEILSKLTPAQNLHLESGRLLINPVNGDMVVPVMRQGCIAKIIVNIY